MLLIRAVSVFILFLNILHSDKALKLDRLRTNALLLPYSASTITGEDCNCANSITVTVGDKSVSAGQLRNLVLKNKDGVPTRIASVIGDEGKSIIIFLRHLACPYCWTYAESWCKLIPKLKDNNIAGPCFVSIGSDKKLRKFLELNPHVPSDSILCDETVKGYNSIGFRNLLENPEQASFGSKNLKLPELSPSRLLSYLTSFGELNPVVNGNIETVAKLGGTFALDGDSIVYSYEDGVPGDHPDPNDVLKKLISP